MHATSSAVCGIVFRRAVIRQITESTDPASIGERDVGKASRSISAGRKLRSVSSLPAVLEAKLPYVDFILTEYCCVIAAKARVKK